MDDIELQESQNSSNAGQSTGSQSSPNRRSEDSRQNKEKIEKCCDGHGFVGTIWDYPEELRDNYFIETGYRCGYKGYWSGFKTIFIWHNETVNVWTHLSGKITVIFIMAWIFSSFHEHGYEGKILQEKLDSSHLNTTKFLHNQIENLEDEIKMGKTHKILSLIEGLSFVAVNQARENEQKNDIEKTIKRLVNKIDLFSSNLDQNKYNSEI